MRLPKPFYKLPLRFDVQRLQQEVMALPEQAWAAHPTAIPGNSAVRLISADGGDNDAVFGTMLPTQYLNESPYLRQVLASFGVVWSRSRLMKLAPGAGVPEHADINYHWFNRVRLHIPIITRPEVRFHCDGHSVHMAAGEAWLFDNWRLHSVENPTAHERVHLVADTTGTAAFWNLVAQSEQADTPLRQLPFDPAARPVLLTERAPAVTVMPPAEVDMLIMDMHRELAATAADPAGATRVMHYHALLDSFSQDWRQLYLLHGEARAGWAEYLRLRDGLREASRQVAEGLIMRTNRVAAHTVLQGRVIQHLLHLPIEPGNAVSSSVSSGASSGSARTSRLREPVFIVAAPRSGSTLLFETLAVTPQLCTLGGEAHWLVESIRELQPGAPGVESNRLTAAHCTDAIAVRIIGSVLARLQHADGSVIEPTATNLRFLEKTPKNSLRIPFFTQIFPDARFVFLWRDPHENISSIIEAWRSGNWVTYRGLCDWQGVWSLLLPPGWQGVRDQPLEEIAAYQWESTNRIALDDLNSLSPDRWVTVNYADLLSNPATTIGKISDFIGIDMDAALTQRVSAPLPLSRYTHTPPAPDKWRNNEAAVLRVMPSVKATWDRLRQLS